MHGVQPITAEHSPTARPVEQQRETGTSGSVLNVEWL